MIKMSDEDMLCPTYVKVKCPKCGYETNVPYIKYVCAYDIEGDACPECYKEFIGKNVPQMVEVKEVL